MILDQILIFGRISILNLLSNIDEKSTFMAIHEILISKSNSPSAITSESWKPIQNLSHILILELLRILNLELLTVVVNVIDS